MGWCEGYLASKKVGHGGTLDPAATGVLPIAVGRATRLLPYLAPDKAYEAVVRFGVTTRTDDLEGEILSQNPVAQIDLQTVQALLPEFVGTIEQVPPAFSAIQVNGQRLYDLARQGKEVTAPSRTVTIHKIAISAWRPGDFPELTLQIVCGAGTYIRSIARDFGEKLGCGATLAHLVRTRSSGFDLKDSFYPRGGKSLHRAGKRPFAACAVCSGSFTDSYSRPRSKPSLVSGAKDRAASYFRTAYGLSSARSP